MDQLLTPRGLVLTLASLLEEGQGVGTRFDSGREVAFCWVWAIFFGAGVLVLFCAVCFAICFCFFFVWYYLTLALFWVGVALVFFVGQFWA